MQLFRMLMLAMVGSASAFAPAAAGLMVKRSPAMSVVAASDVNMLFGAKKAPAKKVVAKKVVKKAAAKKVVKKVVAKKAPPKKKPVAKKAPPKKAAKPNPRAGQGAFLFADWSPLKQAFSMELIGGAQGNVKSPGGKEPLFDNLFGDFGIN